MADGFANGEAGADRQTDDGELADQRDEQRNDRQPVQCRIWQLGPALSPDSRRR